ncbi:MAG: acyltransferase [Anaerolineales bacterium]
MKNYIKELDGLRGLAVLLVIAYHIFSKAAYFIDHPLLLFISRLTAVGWVGVDIFFTLSGFLITSILLKVKGQPGYFKNFYARRTLRIFPLYIVGVSAIIVLMSSNSDVISAVHNLIKALPFFVFYTQNWLMVFSGIPVRAYLGITWSLAVEEQFYLLWPWVVHYFEQRKLIYMALGFILVSMLFRAVGVFLWKNTSQAVDFFYYSSFTRFEEAMIGSVLAISLTYEDLKKKISQYAFPLFTASLVSFLFLCLISYPNNPHPFGVNIPLTISGYTLSSLFTAALISIFVLHPERTVLHRIFQSQILVFFAKYSYSMYLFHMTIALVLKDILWNTGLLGWKAYFLYIFLVYFLTTILAMLTWHLFEEKILQLKKYFNS